MGLRQIAAVGALALLSFGAIWWLLRHRSKRVSQFDDWPSLRQELNDGVLAATQLHSFTETRRRDEWVRLLPMFTRRLLRQLTILRDLILKEGPPTELLAGCSRQLYELRVTVTCLAKGRKEIDEFASAWFKDAEDVNLGSKAAVADDSAYAETVQLIDENIHRLQMGRERMGLPPSKRRWPVGRELAKKAEDEAESEKFYSLFSKYEHPTPWLVITPEVIEEETTRRLFVLMGARYARRILRVLYEAANDGSLPPLPIRSQPSL